MITLESRRLTLAIYKAIQRWALAHRDVPFTIRRSDIQGFRNPEFLPVQINGFQELSETTRNAFKHPHSLEVDSGLCFLRALNNNISEQLLSLKEARIDRQNRLHIKHRVGQVFRHSKYKYKGVIIGWDRSCTRPQEWSVATGVKRDQPHYLVLPDEDDCAKIFGGVRIQKYVGEENIDALEDGTRIAHRSLSYYFTGFCGGSSMYVPTAQLQYTYPCDSVPAEKDIVSIAEDTNILIREEYGEEAVTTQN